MGYQRLFLNVLLALALALPLAAVESHSTFTPPEEPVVKPVIKVVHNPAPPAQISTSPELVDLVGEKVSKRLETTKRENRYDKIIKKVALDHKISPALVKAVIRAESNFNPNAISPMGAVGLMQVMPETARRVGVRNPMDPKSNIIAGTRYLKSLLEMFNYDEALALAAYNSGPNRVKRYGRIPPIGETRVFVRRVMAYYRSYIKS